MLEHQGASPEIIIRGGGMCGLTVAHCLQGQNKPYQLNEIANHWGGKLQTTHHHGYALDHGFQVIQSAYPALEIYKKAGYLQDMKAFGSGAWLLSGASKTLVADPLRHFPLGVTAIFHRDIKPSDLWALFQLRSRIIGQSPANLFIGSTLTTHQFLLQSGFSESFIEFFFRPFFTGIFLEEGLSTPSSMFQFVFWALLKGAACLLPQGIETLPKRIVSGLDASRIHLNVQTSPSHQLNQPYRSTTVVYYGIDHDAGLGKFIGLNTSRMGKVNLLAVPSAVQRGYAPAGKHLLTVSLKPAFSGTVNTAEAQSEIITEVENLLQMPLRADFLKIIDVPRALPSETTYEYQKSSLQREAISNPINAGAVIANPSLNAAILGGMAVYEQLKSQ